MEVQLLPLFLVLGATALSKAFIRMKSSGFVQGGTNSSTPGNHFRTGGTQARCEVFGHDEIDSAHFWKKNLKFRGQSLNPRRFFDMQKDFDI